MVTENMITELTQTVSTLKRDVDVLKGNNSYLYEKLEKAYDDRIVLRSENYKLKEKLNGSHVPEKPKVTKEEECIACSAQVTMAYTYAKPTKKVKIKKETERKSKYNPKTKAKTARTARGKYTLPRKGFMR